ncbi:T-cell surface glycoprotein CD5-like, partial [Arapaima gigas]
MAEALAVSLLAAVIVAADASRGVNLTAHFTTSPVPSTSAPPPPSSMGSSPTTCQGCPLVASCPPESLPRVTPPTLGFVLVTERSVPCTGEVHLHLHRFHSLPLCNDSVTKLNQEELCKSCRCGKFLGWKKLPSVKRGYQITNGMVVETTCHTVEIQCEVGSVDKQMAAYRTAMALLCTVLLLLLLVLFGPTAYRAALKRKSGKKKDRWIGPMQSQSGFVLVILHGPGCRTHVPSGSFTDMCVSATGLERLAVSASREPSSNRNSSCDSY